MVLFSFVFMPNILMNSLRLFQSLYLSSQRSSMLKNYIQPMCYQRNMVDCRSFFSSFWFQMSKLESKVCMQISSSFWVHLSLSLPNILAKVRTCAFDMLCIKTSNELSHGNPRLNGFKGWTLHKQRVLHEAFPGMRPLMQSLARRVYTYLVTK